MWILRWWAAALRDCRRQRGWRSWLPRRACCCWKPSGWATERAAVTGGGRIVEEADVVRMEFSDSLRLHIERRLRGKIEKSVMSAEKVLLTTNAGSRELAGTIYSSKESSEPRLTFAIATAPL